MGPLNELMFQFLNGAIKRPMLLAEGLHVRYRFNS